MSFTILFIYIEHKYVFSKSFQATILKIRTVSELYQCPMDTVTSLLRIVDQLNTEAHKNTSYNGINENGLMSAKTFKHDSYCQ